MKRRLTALLLAMLTIVTLIPMVSAKADSKLAALTFDDGPSEFTPALLDGLAERGVQATFFVQGCKVASNEEVIRRMVAEGHQVANHSWNHPELTSLPLETALSQLTRTNDAINAVTGGSESYYCRAPYGSCSQAIMNGAKAPFMYWTVDTRDWENLNSAKTSYNIVNQTADGYIVLMHDTVSTTPKGVLDAIDQLLEQGYEFVTLKELFRRRGAEAVQGTTYYSVKSGRVKLDALEQPSVSMTGDRSSVTVTLETSSDAPIYYTLDGSPILYDAQVYTGPFTVSLPCTIRAVTALDLNGSRSAEWNMTYQDPPAAMPQASVENGRVRLKAASSNETPCCVVEGAAEQRGEYPKVPADSWFTYYATSSGKQDSPSKRLLFTAEGNLFSDVQPGKWYYESVDQAAAKRWIRSIGGFAMAPEGGVTRAMLAQMLYWYSGEKISVVQSPFSDVDAGADYAEAVIWGYEKGYFEGIGNGQFAPDRLVTRQELAKVLALMLPQAETAAEPVTYRDARSIAAWAKEYVQTVTAAGLLVGDANGSFCPNGTLIRAEMATVLMRMDDILR